MKNVLFGLVFCSLALVTPQAAKAQELLPTPTTWETAHVQLRPLIEVLQLNERQVLAVEKLLIAEALAPNTVPQRTRTLQLILASAQFAQEQHPQSGQFRVATL